MNGSEQLVMGYMKPGRDYTSTLLSKCLKVSPPTVNKILLDAYKGGCLIQESRRGVQEPVYQTKQLPLIV